MVGEEAKEEDLSKIMRLLSKYLVYLRNPFAHYEELPKERLLRIVERSVLIRRLNYRAGENNCISGSVELYRYADKYILKLEEIGMDECGAWGELAIAMIPSNELAL